jgi:multicomponent Na+:H+ antiporter subunit E
MIVTALAFIGVWWVLAEGDLTTWPAALLGVPAALAAFRMLGGATLRIRPFAALAFAPFFLSASVRGGIDVARRALGRELRIDPVLHRHQLALRDPQARVVYVNVVSLLPGTFSADVADDVVTVHLLDGALPRDMLHDLEARIARVFGEEPRGG